MLFDSGSAYQPNDMGFQDPSQSYGMQYFQPMMMPSSQKASSPVGMQSLQPMMQSAQASMGGAQQSAAGADPFQINFHPDLQKTAGSPYGASWLNQNDESVQSSNHVLNYNPSSYGYSPSSTFNFSNSLNNPGMYGGLNGTLGAAFSSQPYTGASWDNSNPYDMGAHSYLNNILDPNGNFSQLSPFDAAKRVQGLSQQFANYNGVGGPISADHQNILNGWLQQSYANLMENDRMNGLFGNDGTFSYGGRP